MQQQQVYPKRSVSPARYVPASDDPHTRPLQQYKIYTLVRVCERGARELHITKTKAPRHDAWVPRRGDQNSSQCVKTKKCTKTFSSVFILFFFT